MLGVSRATVNRYAASGNLPARKLGGRTGPYLFERGDVERLAAKNEASC